MRTLAFALALMLAALPLRAQDFPALYNVVDVASDDVLNVRAGPGASNDILAAFSHNSTNIEVLYTNETGRWGRVNAGDQAGWTSMRYLARVPGQNSSLFPNRLWCAGTEPFWSMRLQDGIFTYAAPDTPPADEPVDWAGQSANIGANAYGFSTPSTTGSVVRTACSDGMSDRDYGFALHAVRFGYDGPGMLSGCCTLQSP